MNINVGQVRAQPIAPQGLTRQLVDASAVDAPAIFIRTLPPHPNVFVAPPHPGAPHLGASHLGAPHLGEQRTGDHAYPLLWWLFKTLSIAVAQQLFPDPQTVVSGLCLVFDLMGNVQELVEAGVFDLDDAIALGKVALDPVALPTLLVNRMGGVGMVPLNASTGFIAKVRTAYFAGPLIEAPWSSLTPPPDPELVTNLLRMWRFLTSDHLHAALTNAKKP